MSLLKNLKVRRSLSADSSSERRVVPKPRRSAADELLRYLLDDDGSVVDTVGFKILKPGDVDYQLAFNRAKALEGMIKVADDQYQARELKRVNDVVAKSRELLEAARYIYPPEPPFLGDLYEFDQRQLYRNRFPKIMKSQSGVV